jgi:hypothetical protein
MRIFAEICFNGSKRRLSGGQMTHMFSANTRSLAVAAE